MVGSFRRLIVPLNILLVASLAWLTPWVGASAAPPTLIAQPGVTAPASIAELARALKYDVNLIYEYVYTNIEYTPTYGLKKGALGTLLDGNGNDFDQSALLVALLRASGYTASGAAITSNSIQYLNSTNIGSWLTSYAGNLVSYIRTYDPDNPAPTTRDIIGGNYIKPLIPSDSLPTALPYPTDLKETWSGEVPDKYRTTLRACDEIIESKQVEERM